MLSGALDFISKDAPELVVSIARMGYYTGVSSFQLLVEEIERELKTFSSLAQAGRDTIEDPGVVLGSVVNATKWTVKKGGEVEWVEDTRRVMGFPVQVYEYLFPKKRPYFGPENRPYFGPENKPEKKKGRLEDAEKIIDSTFQNLQKSKKKVEKVVTQKKEEFVDYVSSFELIERLYTLLNEIKNGVSFFVNNTILILVLLIVYNIIS